MVASIRTTQKSTKRRAKAQFDSSWSSTTIRETCEKSQQRIHLDLLVNLYWAINAKNMCNIRRLEMEYDHLERCNNIKKVRRGNGSSWKSGNIKRLKEEYDHLERCSNIKRARRRSGSPWKNNNIKRPKEEYEPSWKTYNHGPKT